MGQTRREFLGTLVAAAVVPSWADRVEAGEPAKSTNITKALTDTKNADGKPIPLIDQEGKEFDPEILNGKPYMLVFGYESCPLCEKISETLGVVQAELLKAGKEIPIVVVSIHPLQKSDAEELKQERRSFIAKYSQLGVKEYGREEGEKPARRLLHVLWAPSQNDAMAIHTAAGRSYNKSRPDVHTPLITLCDGNGHAMTDSKGEQILFDGNITAGKQYDGQRRKVAEGISKALGDMGRSP